MPPQLLPGSYALPSLLAHIASDRFCDGLPLHRQEDRFARLGATIYRSTMARWLEERQLRKVACGRKAWLFVGSDDHGQAAGNLLTLIASARLHKLDPELYLRDVFRVLPHWPRERYLELAPRYWSATRARLDPNELEQELGPLKVPEPPLPMATAAVPLPAELDPAP